MVDFVVADGLEVVLLASPFSTDFCSAADAPPDDPEAVAAADDPEAVADAEDDDVDAAVEEHDGPLLEDERLEEDVAVADGTALMVDASVDLMVGVTVADGLVEMYNGRCLASTNGLMGVVVVEAPGVRGNGAARTAKGLT